MSRLNQELGLVSGVALLATSLLGTGIFVVPALAARAAGSASLWAWLLLWALVMPLAFTFAQLGRRDPHAGGAPHLIGRAFGPRLEQVSSWLFLLVMPVGLPAALQIASGFWAVLWPLSGAHRLLIEWATLAAIGVLGVQRVRASGALQSAIAVGLVASVALLWWLGDLPRANQPLLPSIDGMWSALAPALALMFWCFVGIEAFIHLGEEFKRPRRDLPLALVLGVSLAALVYWACSVALVSLPTEQASTSASGDLPALFASLLGEPARLLVAVLGYLACFASMNIYLQGFARLLWSQADEGVLPARLASLNGNGVPARALLVVLMVCALCSGLAHAGGLDVDGLIRYANGNFALIYLLSMAAGVRLLSGSWRWIAALSALLCAAVLVLLASHALYALAVTAVLYLVLPTRERVQRPVRS